MPLLVRTWNVFHGNSVPPGRRAYLEQMIRLATADGPDVLCLQELPIWALRRLECWSGMRAVGARAAAARLGPLPWGAELGRIVTELDHGLLRSAFTGQANAVLVSPRLDVVDAHTIVLNPRRFRAAQARWLGLDAVTRLAWAKERRVCQAVRARLPDGRTAVVGNLHATGYAADERLPEAELRRAAAFLETLARPGEPIVLCGDTNVRPGGSVVLGELVERGFSAPASGIDQVLVRGLDATPPDTWEPDRRRVEGRLVSDHAPVEVMLR